MMLGRTENFVSESWRGISGSASAANLCVSNSLSEKWAE